MTIVRLVAVALACLSVSGCMPSLPINWTVMTPEQIKEAVKDKSISATCGTMNTVYGRGFAVNVGIDKSVILDNGSVQVDDQCKVTVTNGARTFPPPRP